MPDPDPASRVVTFKKTTGFRVKPGMTAKRLLRNSSSLPGEKKFVPSIQHSYWQNPRPNVNGIPSESTVHGGVE
jgi:hypothetical protein